MPLTTSELVAARRHFCMFDLDGSGSIDENELAAVLLNLGRDASPTAVKRMLSELDTDGDGSVSEDEFIQLLEMIKRGESKQTGFAATYAARVKSVETVDELSRGVQRFLTDTIGADDPKRFRAYLETAGKKVYCKNFDLLREPGGMGRAAVARRKKQAVRADSSLSDASYAQPSPTPDILKVEQSKPPEQYEGTDENYEWVQQDQLRNTFAFYASIGDPLGVDAMSVTQFESMCCDAGFVSGRVTRPACSNLFVSHVAHMSDTGSDTGTQAVTTTAVNTGGSPGRRVRAAAAAMRIGFSDFLRLLRPLADLVYGKSGATKQRVKQLVSALLEKAKAAKVDPMAKELRSPKVLKLLQQYEWPLKQLFFFMSSAYDTTPGGTDAFPVVRKAEAKLTLTEFISMCRVFPILPEIASAQTIVRIFRSSNFGESADGDYDTLCFAEFVEALCRLSICAHPLARDDAIQSSISTAFSPFVGPALASPAPLPYELFYGNLTPDRISGTLKKTSNQQRSTVEDGRRQDSSPIAVAKAVVPQTLSGNLPDIQQKLPATATMRDLEPEDWTVLRSQTGETQRVPSARLHLLIGLDKAEEWLQPAAISARNSLRSPRAKGLSTKKTPRERGSAE